MIPQETVVGLDVHADSITAAILAPASNTPEVVKLSEAAPDEHTKMWQLALECEDKWTRAY